MLYGNSPLDKDKLGLKPVMSFTSSVTSVRTIATGETVGYNGGWRAERESMIATVPAGYGDGYPRTAKNGTPVLINGVRAPLVGTVSMDMITVDVTDVEGVDIGSLVELWGENVLANEVGKNSGTNGYEILTRMPGRPVREYIG